MLTERKAVCVVDYLKPYINKDLRVVRLVYFKERVISLFSWRNSGNKINYTVILFNSVMTMVCDL